MATSLDLVIYIQEQINSLGNVRYRKMFGEYLIYLNEKPLFLICDNTLYIKITSKTEPFLMNHEKGSPYPGAKPHFIIQDIDDKNFLCKIAQLLR